MVGLKQKTRNKMDKAQEEVRQKKGEVGGGPPLSFIFFIRRPALAVWGNGSVGFCGLGPGDLD
jgi:hypothetical protein